MQQSNRFLDFAKELIGRYNDPGAYYDEALMIYQEEEQRPEEPSGEAVTYVTNLYHTQNFNKENNLFVQNQSMLTQILEQNFYQNVYPDIIEQITKTVKEELPEAEERMIRSFGEHYLTLRQKEQTEQIQNICKQMFTEYHKNTINVQKEQNTLLWKLENIYNSSIYAVSAVNLTQRERQIIERKVKQLEREPVSVEFQKILQEQQTKTVELRDTEIPIRFDEITQNLTQEIFSTEAKVTVNENQQVPTIMEPGYEPVRLTYVEEQQLSEEAETKKNSEQVSLSENNADKKTEDKQLQETAKELTREILHRTESFVQSAKGASVEMIQQNQTALHLSEQNSSEQKISEQQLSETLSTVTKITEQEAVQVLKVTVPETVQVPKVSESGYEPVRLIYEEEQPQVTEEAETKKISEQVSLSENNADKKTEDKQLQKRAKELTREILHRTESFVQSAKEASAELIKHDQIALQKSGQRKSEQEQSGKKAAEQQISETLPIVTKITEQGAVQVLKVSENGYEPVRLIYEEDQKQTEEAEVFEQSKKEFSVTQAEREEKVKTVAEAQLPENAKELTREILHRTEIFVRSMTEKTPETALPYQTSQIHPSQNHTPQQFLEQRTEEISPAVTKVTAAEEAVKAAEPIQVPKVSETGYDPVRLTYEEEQKLSETERQNQLSDEVSLSEKTDKKTEDRKNPDSAGKLTEEIVHRTESFVRSVKEASAETVQIPKLSEMGYELAQIRKASETGYEPVRLTYEEEQKLSEKSEVKKYSDPENLSRNNSDKKPEDTQLQESAKELTREILHRTEVVQVPKVTENSYDPIRLTYEENQDTASSEQSKKEFLVTQAEREQKAKAAAEAQLQESAKKLTKEIISRTEFVPGVLTQVQPLNYMNQQMKLMYPAETWRVLKGTQSFQSEIVRRYVLSAPGNRAGNVKLQTLGMEPAAIVYSQEEVSADKEQTVKLQKQVEEVVRELKTVEEKTVVQSRKVVEQQKQVVREVLKSQPDILDHAQSTQKLQKQIKKTVETQIDESITQIANRVYRQIEDRLKVERGRRGLF